MLFTIPATYSQLNSKSDSLASFLPVAQEIATLAEGGYRLNPKDYLLIRDNEDPKITEKRLQKFAPLNYLGAAIRLQRTKQNSGEFDIYYDSLSGNSDDWTKVISNIDKEGNTFKDFIIDIFESALVNKIAYVQIELPRINIPEGLNKAQQEAFEANIDKMPYLVEIPLQNMLAENVNLNDKNLNWFKFKSVVTDESPIRSTKYNLQFVLVDAQHITTWTFTDVKLDANGNISQIYDASYQQGKGGYVNFNPDKFTTYPISVEHGRGSCPVVKFELPDSLWMANQVYKAQKLIYGLHMNLLHTAANAGYVQKWGKPFNPNSGVSGGTSTAPISNQAASQIAKNLAQNVGDESLLFMESFNFSEITGDSLTAQQAIIDDLKNYIFTSISLNQATQDPNEQAEISGRAKERDLHLQNVALLDHGSEIISFAKRLLENIALALGQSELDSKRVKVTGMTKFTIKPLSDSIETVERLMRLPKDAVAEELTTEAMNQLATTLLSNHTLEQKSVIQQAVADKLKLFYSATVPNSPNQQVYSDISKTFSVKQPATEIIENAAV